MANTKLIQDIAKGVLGTGAVLGVIFGAVIYSGEDTTSNNDISSFIKDSNFPMESYLYEEKEKENIVKLLEAPEEQEQEKKHLTEDEFKEKSNALQNKLMSNAEQYTKNVFQSNEEIKEDLEKKNLMEFAKLRALQNKSNEVPINRFKEQSQERDFGADKFSNIDVSEQDKASNETKLYRAITADKNIPAQILEAIDSTLNGRVRAQIEDDIYSAMGTTLLIPKGSKAIGEYSSDIKAGSNRFNVIWTRIITPQGHNINLNASITSDLAGNSGVVGDLDERYWQRYGLPLTLSTLTNGTLLAIAQLNSGNGQNQDTQIVLDNSRQDLGYIMKKIIDEQIQIKPKVTVPAGQRIFITPKYDMWFPKPIKGEIMVKYFNKSIEKEEETSETKPINEL
uniref:TrbI protein n=1 Tax=Aliarcobacter butzleri TaxID=28197 RepID=W0LVX6_9BACT|nr:TrbI/VirB10 family protein [Aliarcobacter butzleri]AHG28758.1 trbI protein [Aliarcobacter butzleri]